MYDALYHSLVTISTSSIGAGTGALGFLVKTAASEREGGRGAGGDMRAGGVRRGGFGSGAIVPLALLGDWDG